MLGCRSKQELWSTTRDISGAQTRSKITWNKSELQRTRKGSMKMEDYLSILNSIVDNLLLAGCPVSTSDLMTQALDGLDVEYNPIVVQLISYAYDL